MKVAKIIAAVLIGVGLAWYQGYNRETGDSSEVQAPASESSARTPGVERVEELVAAPQAAVKARDAAPQVSLPDSGPDPDRMAASLIADLEITYQDAVRTVAEIEREMASLDTALDEEYDYFDTLTVAMDDDAMDVLESELDIRTAHLLTRYDELTQALDQAEEAEFAAADALQAARQAASSEA